MCHGKYVALQLQVDWCLSGLGKKRLLQLSSAGTDWSKPRITFRLTGVPVEYVRLAGVPVESVKLAGFLIGYVRSPGVPV